MKKLSSGSTFFLKHIFPALWFGFIVFSILIGLFAGSRDNVENMMMLVGPALMAVIGYYLMKYLIYDLIDEVYDEGTTLLFKNNGKTVRVNLTDIKNVSYTVVINPPRVTISLRHKTEFGDELTFSPPSRLIPFQKNKDIVELIDRIDRARLTE